MNPLLRFLLPGLIGVALAWAGPAREESLTLFESRRVSLAIPEGFTFKAEANELGMTLVQLAAANEQVTASLLFLPDPERQAGTARGRAERMVEQFQHYVEGSVEKAMQFEELEPKFGAGTYCVFTDAKLVGQTELPPSEYHHLTCGLKAWPGVMVVFRIFHNDPTSPAYRAVMALLRESAQERIVPLK